MFDVLLNTVNTPSFWMSLLMAIGAVIWFVVGFFLSVVNLLDLNWYGGWTVGRVLLALFGFFMIIFEYVLLMTVATSH